MIPRTEFIAAVLSCVGTPVVHAGRVAGHGLDCVGLVWAAMDKCGIRLSQVPSYGPLPDGSTLTGGLSLYADRCESAADAHVLQVYMGKHPRHVVVPVAFEGGRIEVVHAWGKHQQVRRAWLTERIHAAWRLRGIE